MNYVVNLPRFTFNTEINFNYFYHHFWFRSISLMMTSYFFLYTVLRLYSSVFKWFILIIDTLINHIILQNIISYQYGTCIQCFNSISCGSVQNKGLRLIFVLQNGYNKEGTILHHSTSTESGSFSHLPVLRTHRQLYLV